MCGRVSRLNGSKSSQIEYRIASGSFEHSSHIPLYCILRSIKALTTSIMAGSAKKAQGGLRKRKGKAKDSAPDAKNKEHEDSAEKKKKKPIDPSLDNNETETNDTPWMIIRSHPLFWAFILLGIPYGVYLAFRWVVLQHPFLPGMRPAVTLSDTRQVLILGSMSSGTSSIANDLIGQQLLEVCPRRNCKLVSRNSIHPNHWSR